MEGSKTHVRIFKSYGSTCKSTITNSAANSALGEREVAGAQPLLVSGLAQGVGFWGLSWVIHPKLETPAEAAVIISANPGLRQLKHQQTWTSKETPGLWSCEKHQNDAPVSFYVLVFSSYLSYCTGRCLFTRFGDNPLRRGISSAASVWLEKG